jgi:hypothetical protein
MSTQKATATVAKVHTKTQAESQAPIIQPPETDESRFQFSPERASADFKLIADWLSKRDFKEKLAGVAAIILLNSDIEANIRESGGYDGDIGNALFTTWNDEIEAAVGGLSGSAAADSETMAVASYLMGLQTAND